MIIHSLLYANEKHKGQTRIGGDPYITHPVEVARLLEEKGIKDPVIIMTALLHDVFEDTDAKEEEILQMGGNEVLTAVKCLTKSKTLDMESYIQGIQANQIAKYVKLADRLHNLRSAIVTSVKFRQRYIEETEKYYIPLAQKTVFEKEIQEALQKLKDSLSKE